MICPACNAALVEQKAGSVTVDVCRDGCAGVWFDNFELQKMDDGSESAGESLLSLSPRTPPSVSDKRSCPRCSGVRLRRFFHSVKKEVEIDECPQCAGVWLDAGELIRIRKTFNTEEERKKAAEGYFRNLFDSSLDGQARLSAESAQERQRWSRALRLICPSYWLPGKQSGGAF